MVIALLLECKRIVIVFTKNESWFFIVLQCKSTTSAL